MGRYAMICWQAGRQAGNVTLSFCNSFTQNPIPIIKPLTIGAVCPDSQRFFAA